ncbi:pentapeptide repeat-containing protein [Labilibaculum euxinus]
MNKKDLLIERTSISDIKEIKGEDGVSRHELNTPTKIIVWIKYQFEQQEIDYNKEYRPFSFSKRIDLSNCIINTSSISGKPSLTNLCYILKANDKGEKLDCFINNGFGNKYNHEVKVKIDCRNSLIHSGFFQNTKFHESVNFEDSTFDGYASFSNCLFTKYANFQNVKFIRNSNFDRCIFNEDVYFNKVIFDTHEVSFDNSIFKGNFHGQSIEFKTDPRRDTPFIDFRYSEFHKDVDLSYSKFNRACYFGDAKFHGNILFRKTHFEVSICFYDTVIGGNILFTAHSKEGDSLDGTPNIIKTITFRGAKISGRIDFENCKIESLEACFTNINKGALFRIYESKINYLNFRSVHNDGIIILANNQDLIDEITFKSAINTGLIEIENTKVKIIEDRKTARLLKDSALKSGNTIDGLNYKAKEMALYQKELISKIKPSLELKTLLSNLLNSIKRKIVLSVLFAIPAIIIALISHQILNTLIAFLIISVFIWTSVGLFLNEMIVLLLNTISNKNGLSWFRGLTFTLVAWILFYGLFIMSRDGIGDVFFLSIETNREGFINYLWLPSGLKDLFNDSKTTSWLSSSIFILGKIAIAYGIYQTITAFRKYKN